MSHHQLLLDNMPAIQHGVRRAVISAGLSKVDVADLVQDVCAKLLDGRLESFDESKGSATVFFRTVAWRVATDAVRAMARGGQFSGYLSGFENVHLDAPKGGEVCEDRRFAHAQSAHVEKVGAADAQSERGRAVRVSGQEILPGESFEDELAERQWAAQARAAVAEVLPMLTAQEQELYALLASGDFDAASYAQAQGISPSTAHVRANRLRSKLRELLAQAA